MRSHLRSALTTLAFVLLLISSPVSAGVYCALGIGHGHMLNRLDVRSEIGIGHASLDGLGGHGMLVGAVLGHEFDTGRFRYSVEFDFTLDNIETALRVRFLGDAADGVLEPLATLLLGGRAGFEITDQALVFARVGYGTSRYDAWIRSDIDGLEFDDSSDGYGQFWAFGVGSEFLLSEHAALRAEYTYQDYADDTEHDEGLESLLRPSVGWARLGVVYRF